MHDDVQVVHVISDCSVVYICWSLWSARVQSVFQLCGFGYFLVTTINRFHVLWTVLTTVWGDGVQKVYD